MRIVDRGTVFDATKAPADSRFCMFTSLELLSDGKLIVGCRRAVAKASSDEDVLIRVSEDEGATWRTAFDGFGDYAIDGVTGRMRNVLLTEVSPGRLLGHLCWMDHSDPSLPMANPDTQGILPAKLMVAESTDSGSTWHDLREVPLDPPHKASVSTGEILVLKDGAFAFPYESYKEYYDTSVGYHRGALRFSTDGGETWPGDPAVVAHDDEDQRILFWDQRLGVHPEDGRLIALIWTHDRITERDLAIHVTWGSPNGKTWERPVSTGIAGQIASPLVLPDGSVFAAYVHRHDPPSLRAIVSDDFGRTWNTTGELAFYESGAGVESGAGGTRDLRQVWEDMGRWTFGHPACRQLSSGEIMVAYYAGDSNAMGIYWVKIALD